MDILGNAIENWVMTTKRVSVKAATYDRLVTSLTLMKHYDIYGIRIDELEVSDIQRYINELADAGYSLSTIKKQYHLIGAYISYANLVGDIQRPLHKGVKLPSETTVKKHKREIVAYTREEQKRLKNVLMRGDSPAYNVVLVMLETGMRIGEVLALGWDDINWTRKSIRIGKTVVNIANTRRSFVQNSAKSYTSNRTIPMSTDCYELLKFLKSTDEVDSDFVFHDENGDRITYEAVRWWIGKACEEAGIPYYGMHVFRHTFATNCYENGCDVKILSKLLGHSDVTITYNIYIHLFGDALEEMRAVLG